MSRKKPNRVPVGMRMWAGDTLISPFRRIRVDGGVTTMARLIEDRRKSVHDEWRFHRFVNEVGRYSNRLEAFADEFAAFLSRQLDERSR